MDVFTLQQYAIILAWFYACFWEVWEAIRLTKERKRLPKEHQKEISWIWIKWGFAALVLYWSLFYANQVFGTPIGHTHQVFVRAPLLLTIMLIGASASSSALRNRRRK